MDRASLLSSVIGFELVFARRQATHVQRVPGGFAVRHAEFPLSHNNNRLLVTEPADPADVLGAADDALAGLDHRLITVYDDALAATFANAAVGYEHVPLVAMVFAGDPPPPTGIPVHEVDDATLVGSLRQEWRQALPDAEPERIDQLARRVTARRAGADRVDFLGVVDGDRVVARVDLYVQDGVAQLEYVATWPEYRGRGYARAVVVDGVRRARDAGCGLIFLFAEEHDWPSRWYGRLGFTEVGGVHEFLSESNPL